MYIRCGYFIGRVAEADRARFERAMREEVWPLLRALPKILDARLPWGREFEPDAPHLYLTIELAFSNAADVAAALASPARKAVRDCVAQVLPLFEGTVSHVNHAVDV